MSQSTKKLFTTILISVAAAGAVAWLWQQLFSQAAALQAAMQTIANQAAVEQQYRSISELLTRTSEDRALISDLFVEGQQDTITLLDELEQLGAQYAVTIENTRLEVVADPVVNEPVLRVAFAIAGSDAQVLAFLRQLEQLPYASYMESLQYRHGGEREAAAQVALRFGAQNIDTND